ncbi:hypothetical protein GOODEAATRI_017780 [Goodea atripinnis]|uniref:Uncharacterized protein n=1 Tax=Goodea atripinnis TaxID=208336 RepID=A0ABV0NL47_9TELE
MWEFAQRTFSRERSTGECQAVTWRRRQATPASLQRTGCSAPRCSQTLQTRTPKAQTQGSTCTGTQIMQRTDMRCAPAPLTPLHLWASGPPCQHSGCCHLCGRSY